MIKIQRKYTFFTKSLNNQMLSIFCLFCVANWFLFWIVISEVNKIWFCSWILKTRFLNCLVTDLQPKNPGDFHGFFIKISINSQETESLPKQWQRLKMALCLLLNTSKPICYTGQKMTHKFEKHFFFLSEIKTNL